MATEEDVAAGLIDWLNSLAVANPVSTVDDLNNGEVIWKVCQQIDRLSFPGKLPEDPETDQWIHKWTNLKHIYDALSIFLVEECGQRLPLPAGRPDLKAIAQASSLNDTIALLKHLVIAAVYCTDRADFLRPMQDLSEPTQQVLMQTVQETSADDNDDNNEDRAEGYPSSEPNDPQSGPLSPPMPSVDSELASEQRLAAVLSDNTRISHEKRDLQKQLVDLQARYHRLQERLDTSQDELQQTNDRLTSVLAGRSTETPLSSRNETVIASLETRANDAELENDELRKQNETLKIKAERAQKLQDDYDEMKIERDRLARKANAAEKYRQKLEASQDLEKDNATLRQKVIDLQSQLKQSDLSHAGSSDLQREVDEYRRLLPSIEQENSELNEMKKRLALDFHALEARYVDTVEQLKRQRAEVEELQGRLADYEDGVTPAPRERPATPTPVDLDLDKDEAEFAESEARLAAALLQPEPVEQPAAEAASQTPGLSGPATPSLSAAGHSEDETISESELKAIMSAMRARAANSTATERQQYLAAQRKLVSAIERQMAKNRAMSVEMKTLEEKVRKEVEEKARIGAERNVEAGEDMVKDSKRAEKSEKEEDAGPLQQEEEESLFSANERLRRELKLMASAWYEQSLRLASLSQVGGRRNGGPGVGVGEPRGFLGRQRRRVDVVSFGR